MPKFKFSKRILESYPNRDDINEIVDDFEDYINRIKLGKDNLQDESIRTRHLSDVPVKLIYKDCSEDIFRTGTMETSFGAPDLTYHRNFYQYGKAPFPLFVGEWGVFKTRSQKPEEDLYENSSRIDFKYTEGSVNRDEVVAEITALYYPYSMGSRSWITFAYYTDEDGWVIDKSVRQQVGYLSGKSGESDMQPYSHGENDFYPSHPCLINNTNTSELIPPNKDKTGRPSTDVLKTVAYAAPVRITMQVTPDYGRRGLHKIKAFGVAVFVTSEENTSMSGELAQWDGAHFSPKSTREYALQDPPGFRNAEDVFNFLGPSAGPPDADAGNDEGHVVFSNVYFNSTVSRFDRLILSAVVREG